MVKGTQQRDRHNRAQNMSETTLLNIRAAVYHYLSEWTPADEGLSNIGIYHNPTTDAYRVVAMDAISNSVIINSPLFKELTYAECSRVFHQWSDTKFVYGLNFATVEDAEMFRDIMMRGVVALGGADVVLKGERGYEMVGNGEEDKVVDQAHIEGNRRRDHHHPGEGELTKERSKKKPKKSKSRHRKSPSDPVTQEDLDDLRSEIDNYITAKMDHLLKTLQKHKNKHH
eukprot:TRINITY_DN272_c3_g1_i1.p1 TRINITY_DN272_c3_g1~~TRINITY_DN272_c3_g1_i1.p1  ORF type:complete len:228 (+),score=50.36 TRINITY_DN272_c3_g1_i1:186-869(+)